MLLERMSATAKKGVGDIAMNQEGLHRITNAGALTLSVDHDAFRHREIGGSIDVNMADSIVMLYHRHAGALRNGLNKFFAPTRDNPVNVLIHLGPGANGASVSQVNDPDCLGDDTVPSATLTQRFV